MRQSPLAPKDISTKATVFTAEKNYYTNAALTTFFLQRAADSMNFKLRMCFRQGTKPRRCRVYATAGNPAQNICPIGST
jgi:hypothetical protein